MSKLFSSSILIKHKFLFSPLFLYFLIWSMMLVLYSTKTLYWGPLHANFYIAIFINFTAILFGLLYAKIILKKKKNLKREDHINNFKLQILLKKNKIKKIFYLFCLLGSFGVFMMLLTIFKQISFSNMLLFQATVKGEINRDIFGIYLATLSFVAIPLGVLLHKVFNQSRLYYLFPLFLCFLFSFSFFGRVPFIVALIILVSSNIMLSLTWEKQVKRKKNRTLPLFKLFLLGICIIFIIYSFMSWTIYWRVKQYGENYNPVRNIVNENIITQYFEQYEILFGSKNAALITYSYLVASIPTLNYWVSRESDYALGQASFPYFFRFAHKLGLVSEPIVGDRVLGTGMQLPSFIGYAYIDFGFLGVFIYSFFLGIFSTYIYDNFLLKPKLISYYSLTIIYVIVLLSPYIFAFTFTFVLLMLTYMLIANYLITKVKF